ncbi:hypothetical protein BIW11_04778 [Tropilaelaps mercedesae]|uniref:Uncharacterized protein n=1 Tax=Tropilaelaps mercedesae TaxID=418985 RepID=A0A1V9X1A3_9ACAR|nr:hypothetical protein BIW11_04778 [Tropilaelaps mercedesae]
MTGPFLAAPHIASQFVQTGPTRDIDLSTRWRRQPAMSSRPQVKLEKLAQL